MNNCTFCKIINGEIFGKITQINEKWATLVPLQQETKGHILVISLIHISNIHELDKEALSTLGDALQKTSTTQKNKFKADGINILTASGNAAQQSVPHIHFHIVPRYVGDNLNLWFKTKH